MLYWILLIILWLPVTILFPTKIIGKKNLIKNKSIWACNHQSNLDPVILGTKSLTRIYALGKSELFKNKFSAWFYKTIGCVGINRGKADLSSIKNCLKILKEKDKPLLIFPTGTRTSTAEEVDNLKNGVALFSIKSQAPIIPMVFIRRPKLFKFNRLVIGEPLDLSIYENRKADKQLFNEIIEKLSQAMESLLNQYSYKRTTKEKEKEGKI